MTASEQAMPDLREERRQYARFQVGEGAYAFIDSIPFTIQDISMGGMKIQSVIFDDALPEDVRVDIFVNNADFYLRDIPVRLVCMLQNEATTPFTAIRVSSFGFEFGDLTGQQKKLVDDFITHNTVGEA
jgi:c-di-GMP-binding flagellar brake protein YcgR